LSPWLKLMRHRACLVLAEKSALRMHDASRFAGDAPHALISIVGRLCLYPTNILRKRANMRCLAISLRRYWAAVAALTVAPKWQ
jgi:hypothetical protein